MTGSAELHHDFANHLAYFDCSSIQQNGWLAYRQINLPIDDLGFRQGVTAVERLRTYAGQPFQRREHLARFENTQRLVQIGGVPGAAVIGDRIDGLLARNASLLASHGDVGITLWATPGRCFGDTPTLALHLNAIDHAATESRQKHGQAVVLTDTVQPSQGSWSRQAKVRCRMHYYLADAQAGSLVPGATGILRDTDGSWTESSIANIALLSRREIIFAPASQVLPGITQAHVEVLARSRSLTTRQATLTTQMIARADAMLLMGTDHGLWFAKSIHDATGHRIQAASSDSAIELIADLQSRFASLGTREP